MEDIKKTRREEAREERRICDKFKIRRKEARIDLHDNKCFSCNPRIPLQTSEENRTIDFLEASWLIPRISLQIPPQKKTALVPYISLFPIPSIKLDRSRSLPREANSICISLVSCGRVKSTRRCETAIGSRISIQARVSLRESSRNDSLRFSFQPIFVTAWKLGSIASMLRADFAYILTYRSFKYILFSRYERYFRARFNSLLIARGSYVMPRFFLVRIGSRKREREKKK